MKIIVPSKTSRPVEFNLKDIWRVIKDSWRIKWAMLSPFPGKYPVASSISHCQMEENDPLRFFVLGNSWHVFEGNPVKLKKFFGFPWPRTIINPEIIAHGKSEIKSREGCMGFPHEKTIRIKRWEVIVVKYWTFFGPREKKFYLYRACVIQHEIDHMNNVTIDDRYRHKIEL